MNLVIAEEAANAQRIILPRDTAVQSLANRLKAETYGCPLVFVKGPSGSGKSAMAGACFPNQLRKLTGRSHPRVIEISLSSSISVAEITARIADQIIEHHSEFRSRKTSAVFREKTVRGVRSAPAEGAERLRSMIRAAEKNSFELDRIQLLIHLDGVDRLFENHFCASEGRIPQPEGPRKLWEFLSRLTDLKTILFVASCRDWVWDKCAALCSETGFSPEKLLVANLPYPDESEIPQIVGQMFAPLLEKANAADSEYLELFSDLLIEDLKENPSAVSLLPEVFLDLLVTKDGNLKTIKSSLDRFEQSDGLAGLISRKGDEVYLRETFAGKLAADEFFTRIIEAPRHEIALRSLSKSPEHWQAVFRFVDQRVLFLHGESLRHAGISPSHRRLLTIWHRAAAWSGDQPAMGLSRVRFFDSKALAWELGERKKTLLLQDDEDRTLAQNVLASSELSSNLSPLTREFLTLSTLPRKDRRSLLRTAALATSAVMIFLLGLGIFLWILGAPEDPSASQAVPKPELAVFRDAPGHQDITGTIGQSPDKLFAEDSLPPEPFTGLERVAREALQKIPVGSPPPFLPSASALFIESAREFGAPFDNLKGRTEATPQSAAKAQVGIHDPAI